MNMTQFNQKTKTALAESLCKQLNGAEILLRSDYANAIALPQ